MPIVIEAVPTRYRGRRMQTARVLIDGAAFDLGLADTARAIDMGAAKTILRALYDRAGTEPRDAEQFLDEAGQLSVSAKEFTRWKEPQIKDRRFGKRRTANRLTTWRGV
jgi:hypothetical protein